MRGTPTTGARACASRPPTAAPRWPNLRHDPRASFHVAGSSHWSYGVVEGRVELSGVAIFHDDDAVEELVRVYRNGSRRAHGEAGEAFRLGRLPAGHVDDRRLVARLVVEHAYGLVR